MAKNIKKEKGVNDEDFEKIVKERLKDIFRLGLSQGTKAVCSIVLEEIAEKNKSSEDKLKTLKDFCERSLALNPAKSLAEEGA